MLCYRCGSYNPEGARACMVCGQALAQRVQQASDDSAKVYRGRPPFEPGHLFAERYRIIAPIEPGTCGWVMRATDLQRKEDVALKVILSNLVQTSDDRKVALKAIKEARRIQHPYVAPIYHGGTDRGLVYYTMPYLEGITLRKIVDLRCAKAQAFTWPEALALLKQIAEGLAALAPFGAHGALRPTNVLVQADHLQITGVPHLLGLPRRPFVAMQRPEENTRYLAPEVQRDDIVTPSSDVYSVGIILAEMLTGACFRKTDAHWEFVVSSLPDAGVAILRCALNDKPDARYTSARRLVDAAERVAEVTSPPTDSAFPTALGTSSPCDRIGGGEGHGMGLNAMGASLRAAASNHNRLLRGLLGRLLPWTLMLAAGAMAGIQSPVF